MRLAGYLSILILISLFCTSGSAQQSEAEKIKINPCNQAKKDTIRDIKNAEANTYRISRIEIWGNTYTRDKDFRNAMILKGGDIFTKKSLDETIANFGKMKQLKPVTIKNIKMSLDTENKDIYMIFCVEEKGKQ